VRYNIKFLAAIAISLSSVVYAAGPEPRKPQFNGQEISGLLQRAAYAAFMGDACSINHSIPEQIRKLVKVVAEDPNVQQRLVSEFNSQKTTYQNDASTVGVLKRCYVDSGKTRALVSDRGRDIEDKYQAAVSKTSAYLAEYSSWTVEVARERAEVIRLVAIKKAEDDEKNNASIRTNAQNIAELLGRTIVNKAYQGGQNIGTQLVSYDYSPNDSTYRLKVEIRWNGAYSGQSGYGASGMITAKDDSSTKWEYGRNYSWNQTWQSPLLEEWIEKRPLFNILRELAK
jgi:anti-sigma regulatory factor (Ser/Thr protein kinase)